MRDDDDFWLFANPSPDDPSLDEALDRARGVKRPRLCSNCDEPGHRRDGCPLLKTRKGPPARLELIRQRAEERRRTAEAIDAIHEAALKVVIPKR